MLKWFSYKVGVKGATQRKCQKTVGQIVVYSGTFYIKDVDWAE